MKFRFDVIKADTTGKIKTGIKTVLSEKYSDLLPSDKNAPVLIKPNLNSNMNALTGNTTDLRLLASVIEFLKESGYSNVTIGEGTNSGFYRSRISVISRLMIDALAAHYGITVKDLNYSTPAYIDFEQGVKAGVARECIEAELFINMPKLKTHFEAGMSACLKNLIGCLVGQENKKKTHKSLAANILNINKAVKPHIHIVDAVISMEGLGPTRGTPVKTGTVFIGTDPYLIDMACAKFASFDMKKVRTIQEAEKRGIIDERYHKFVDGLDFGKAHAFKPPKAGPIATFIHSPKRQKYFLAIRNTPLFNYICSTELAGKLLYATGLRQDVFIEDEMECRGLSIDRDKCDNCGKCMDYCPLGMEMPDESGRINDNCIHCLYCFCICPKHAVEFKGKLGFMLEQLKQYDEIIRKIG
jgi:uncharacterized protein (DUF362 family)/ferredoxin